MRVYECSVTNVMCYEVRRYMNGSYHKNLMYIEMFHRQMCMANLMGYKIPYTASVQVIT